MKERHLEDILEKYSDLIEPGLTLIRRQPVMYGRRMDLLFEDQNSRKLVVELKAGPIKDEHVGQLVCYQGMLLSVEDPTVRAMLIGTRVPSYIKKALDHYGIAWREIKIARLKEYLAKVNDKELLSTVISGESEPEATGFTGEETEGSIKPTDGEPNRASKTENGVVSLRNNDEIVQRICGWADGRGYEIETNKWGSLIAMLEDDQRLITKFGIASDFLYLNLEHINYTRPFQERQKQQELFDRIVASLPNANISPKARSGNGSAGIRLSHLEDEKALLGFYDLLDWMAEQVRVANERLKS